MNKKICDKCKKEIIPQSLTSTQYNHYTIVVLAGEERKEISKKELCYECFEIYSNNVNSMMSEKRKEPYYPDIPSHCGGVVFK